MAWLRSRLEKAWSAEGACSRHSSHLQMQHFQTLCQLHLYQV